VLGGDYRALGVVRSLGRHGIPVWVVRAPDDHRLAGLSRYRQREVVCPSDDDAERLGYLAELNRRHGLHGWVLFPTADASAAFVARQHAALSESYRPTTPPWDVYRWGYDKRCTGELARSAGIAYPRTVVVPTRADAQRYAGDFPVILKPATKPHLNRPSVKAWPAEDTLSLLRSYDLATAETDPETLLLQELIPGVRHVQYSFAALCVDGRAVATVTAERVRQHPPDFGRSSTFVITIEEPEVERAARRVLEELGLTGLAEVEFKKDPRDGSHRLLDINVRVWGWHTIARRAGLDFPYLAWRLAVGQPIEDMRAPAGLRWLRLTTDVAAGLRAITSGQLSARAYLSSVRWPHERAVAAADDPLPWLAEVPLFVHQAGWAALSRHVREARAPHALGPRSGCADPRPEPRDLPPIARGDPLSVADSDHRPGPTSPAEVSR
jgi:predicted ATP-grasp superfamily ATP-dependent carboligase